MIVKHSKSVLLFASAVALLVLISAFFTERDGLADESGFLNPPYMLAQYGKLTFPVYPHSLYYDLPVITHPPIHVAWIGALWRLGMPPYYAEATATVLLFLLAILIVVFGAFPPHVKLGWLFSIGFLASSGETLTLCFGTRPEGELLATWLCGLLLLESGRLDRWNLRRLFAGSLFLTWTSATHYYAGPALLGVLVYAVWAVRSVGWKRAKRPVAAIVAGCLLLGLPYLTLYLLPYYPDIRAAIAGNQGPGGIGLSIQRHLTMYREWAGDSHRPPLIRLAMALGIPLFVFSAALLAAVRSTRGIALAALPLQLGLFLFAWHKIYYYFVHECVLFAAALAIGGLALCHRAIELYAPRAQRMFVPVAALFLAFFLVSGSPMLARAVFSAQPRFLESEVAQAAGRRILGPNARVGGRWWGWHSAGAAHWFDIERDLVVNATALDPDSYISNLDALAVCYETDQNNRVYDWFAEGKLKLRGFFFGQSSTALRCVQLSPRVVAPLTGYAELNDQLYRFQEDPRGDREVLTTVCPVGSGDEFNDPPHGWYSAAFRLPNDASGAPTWILTVLGPRGGMAPAGRVGQGCREVSRTTGTLVAEDRRALVAWSRRNEAPIHFYRGLDEMPGYHGVGLPPDAAPPADAVTVPGILDFAGMDALPGSRIQPGAIAHLTTTPLPGGFSAVIPVKNAESVVGPCWVVLKMRVTEGRIGFGAAAEGGTLLAHTLGFAPSPEPQTIALEVKDFRTARNIILFNRTSFRGAADILDAAVLRKR